MPDRTATGDLTLYLVAALLTLFVASSKLLQAIGSARPAFRIAGNFLETFLAGWIGGAIARDYLGDVGKAPGTFTVAVIIGAWMGGYLLDRLSEAVLKRWLTRE